ncbi:MAG TPA: hypothetical protein VGQ39_05285 [Pyrinomonadaceae bacterium]|jgi:hypothetical protein|nr:hypothetical protein [Pyrinomonadaceae bacterium]
MKKRGLSVLAATVLTFATAAFALAQTTTTTVTKTVQNPDGTYTVIEYPAKKEVTVNLNPIKITGAKGVATILRDDDGTKIKLNLTSIPAEVTTLTLYAVDEAGMVSAIGPVTITNGTGTLMASTPLSKFMLIASPEATLTAYDPNTAVVFRSAVPEGFTVIPMTNARGETVGAVSTPAVTAPATAPKVVVPTTAPTVTAPATAPTVVVTTAPTVAAPTTAPTVAVPVAAATTSYQVAMLNIPAYKKGDDEKIKVDLGGAMTGSRANVFINPRKDGPTEVRVRFHDLKDSPADQKFILWAVSSDNKFVKLGQVVNAPGRNEAEIKSETSLKDFGLLITMESADGEAPTGPVIGTIHIVP